MAVGHRDQRRPRPQLRQQPPGGAGLAARQRLAPIAMQPVRRGDRQQPGAGDIVADRLVRRDCLRRHRAAIGDRQLGLGGRLVQPIGAGDDRLGQRRVEFARRLLDRPGRQPEIHRLAVIALDLGQRPA